MYEKLNQDIQNIKRGQEIPSGSYEDRKSIEDGIRNLVNDFIPHNPTICPEADEIKNAGYVKLRNLLGTEQTEHIREHLLDKLTYCAHVPPADGVLRPKDAMRKFRTSACYQTQDLLAAPYLFDIVTSDYLLSIAENYLGCVPTLYSFNVFWTFPGHPTNGVKLFHRDVEEYRLCCLFIYLNDVDEQTGPHVYVKHTHTDEAFLQRHNDKEFKDTVFPPSLVTGHDDNHLFMPRLQPDADTLTGPAGTSFLADTFGLHRGSNLSKERLVLWVRYGLHENSSINDSLPKSFPLELVKDTGVSFNDKLKYITRRLINHDV